jgi:hypothetical protein
MSYYKIISLMPKAVGYDADAQAFITAAGITDLTQQTAINQLVLDLKGYSIWSKMKALYPFVGGTATTHKFNLKNPLDTNAAYRLVFSGGITHNSNGITGNGTNGFADTFLNDQTTLDINNKHISMYQRNILSATSGSSMGINNQNRFYLNFSGSNYSTLGMAQAPYAIVAPQKGMFTMSKIISGEFKYYQNALAATTRTGVNVAQNEKYFILACNAVGIGFDYSLANLSFVSLGDGFSATEVANLNTSVTTFQTSLSRNV